MEFLLATASELSRRVHDRSASALEIVTDYLDRATRASALNALVTLRAEAVEEARALDRRLERRRDLNLPLAGVPVTIKDAIDVAGTRTTAGTLGAAHRVATEDAAVVQRLRAAGAVIVGKTNTAELGLAYETDNRVFGRTVHPLDARRTPGGSSGGEAAILAAGGSALGLGSDSGGSLRAPAGYCGLQAFKPSPGLVPSAGHFPAVEPGEIGELTQIGPIGRYISDLELSLRVIGGFDRRDSPAMRKLTSAQRGRVALRIAWTSGEEACHVDREVVRVIERAAVVLGDAGHQLEQVAVPEAREALGVQVGLLGGGEEPIRALLATHGTSWANRHPYVDRLVAKMPIPVSEPARRADLAARLNDRLAGFDALLCPVTTSVAPFHGQTFELDLWEGFGWLVLFNLAGWPAASVRFGTDAVGLPIGVQVAASPGRDLLVLRVAGDLETSVPRWQPLLLGVPSGQSQRS